VDFEREREILVKILSLEIKDTRVLRAFSRVPRELFVPLELKPQAYADRPLSIGYGQTISQPYIVAVMTQALELKGHERVLEIGTGSGYQAAILAEIAKNVYSTERIPELAEAARNVLDVLGYANIEIKIAGQDLGWVEKSPFDAIIVTAAAPFVTDKLVDQVAVGGKVIIPVGSRGEQELLKITRGKFSNNTENLGAVRFVPLIGRDAWGEHP
jgi:protein-L-isoaspartate(D-aspartate) O-methyltransferase